MRYALLGLLFFPAISWATLIQFDQSGPAAGSLSYDGSGGALFGSGISFGEIVGTGTPENDGSALQCVNCFMSFQTGPNLFETQDLYLWSGGGSMSLTGEIWDGGIQLASGTLATGSFTNASALFLPSGVSATFNGLGIDTKHENLVHYYGLANPFNFAQSQLALDGEGGCRQNPTTLEFECDVTNADFDNSGTVPPNDVPVPGTLALFGIGLLGLFGLRRKQAAA